jgi:hypothetical protein
MVPIVVTPTWAKLIDFETTLASVVEELARQGTNGGARAEVGGRVRRSWPPAVSAYLTVMVPVMPKWIVHT